MMVELTGKQRQYLKGLAHPLSPVVRVGKAGVSDAVTEEARKSLESHELIKVRIDIDDGAQRKSFAAQLASSTDAQLVASLGKIAILYRKRDEKPEIRLPQ